MFVEISSDKITSGEADAEEENCNNHIIGHTYRDSQVGK